MRKVFISAAVLLCFTHANAFGFDHGVDRHHSGIAQDLLAISDKHELRYNKLVAPVSDQIESAAARPAKLYVTVEELTNYGVNLFKSEKTALDTTELRVRGGFSELSTKAVASVELIVTW